MNSHEVVVRIIQPADKPQPKRPDRLPELVFQPAKNHFHTIINGLVLSVIALVVVGLGVSYFNLGFSFNDVLVIVGIPMTLGIVTSYAIL